MDAQEDEDTLRRELARLRSVEADLSARLSHAEEQLRASQALHAATIESLPFDFWARDREGYCFSQNSTTLANWGDLLHKRPQDMPMDRGLVETWLENNRRALAGETVVGDQQYLLAGEPRSIHNILAPIRMGEEIVGTLGVNIDITERKRAETALLDAVRALRESEAKLRLAVEAAGIGLWSSDLDQAELSWGPSFPIGSTGSPRTTPRGREDYLARVHADDRARVARAIERGIETGRWEVEYRIVRGDGVVRWILGIGRLVREGERRFIVGADIDVTERHMRDERERQAQKLEAVGQLTAGIAHNFNNMLMGMLPYLELALVDAPRDIAPLLTEAQKSGQRAASLVRQLMTYAGRNRGNTRKVEAINPIIERIVELCRSTFDKRIQLELTAPRPVSARVDAAQLEQVLLNLLLNARDALAEAEVSGPVIGGMNPPAGAIASLNESGPVNGGMNPPAGAIASLNESGPVNGGMNPPAGAIASLNESGPVNGGMNPPAGAIASLNESGPVNGGMNPPAGAIASLNASGPKISVDLEVIPAHAAELEGRSTEHLRVRVTDNGIGMDSVTVSRIFEPFFTTKGVGKGSGLGLATTHAIIREHDGWISCESTRGQGTSFRFYLPSEAPASSVREPSRAPLTRGSETVLVVDDEMVVRDVVARVLSSAGFKPLLAASGSEVVRILSDPQVAARLAVVLLDVSMPGMPRSEIRARLREMAPRARVICFTGHAVDALEGDPVLEKPVSNEALLAKVRAVLDERPG